MRTPRRFALRRFTWRIPCDAPSSPDWPPSACWFPLAPPPTRTSRADAKPIRALLVIGGCCHDYAKQKDILTKGIAARANVEVTIAYDPDTGTKHLNPVYEKADWAKGFDVIIHDECCSDVKDLDVIDRILQAAPRRSAGRGAALRHALLPQRGLAQEPSRPGSSSPACRPPATAPQLPIAVTFVDKESPITKGMEDWTTIKEELYNNIAGKLLDTAHPLARGKQRQGRRTSMRAGPTRTTRRRSVFATTLGHNNETVADDRYLDLVTRGLLWATGHLTDDGKPAPGYEAKK